MKNLYNKLVLLVLSVAVFAACDTTQEPALFSGGDFVRFESSSKFLFVQLDRETFTVNVSLVTDQVPTSDQQFTFSVDQDNSTAVEGVHYELPSTTVTIPANSVTASFDITAIKANLDVPVTLVLTFGGTNFSETISVGIQNPIRDALIGDFALSYPWFFGTSDFFAQPVVAAENVANVLAPSMLEAGFDITMEVLPTSDDNILNIDVARQNAWVSGTFGQATAEAEELGTFNISEGQLDLILRHRVSAGTFGAHPMVMFKLPAEKARIMTDKPAPVVELN